jgi:hypothetical protein
MRFAAPLSLLSIMKNVAHPGHRPPDACYVRGHAIVEADLPAGHRCLVEFAVAASKASPVAASMSCWPSAKIPRTAPGHYVPAAALLDGYADFRRFFFWGLARAMPPFPIRSTQVPER